jgi:GNAT superfamily N-acetyltransferase
MKSLSDNLKTDFTVEPLTIKNWNKFIQLFGEKGACGNCWCMAFRLKKSEFEKGKTDGNNKKAMLKTVSCKKPAGILGFIGELPVAWCAFAPREDFIRLENSRIHKRIDNQLVWSIPCFFIDKKYRRQGLSVEFLKKVVVYAKEQGIGIIEAYPVIPSGKLPDAFAWIGLYKCFERAGFKIVDRTSVNRPMVRYYNKTNL